MFNFTSAKVWRVTLAMLLILSLVLVSPVNRASAAAMPHQVTNVGDKSFTVTWVSQSAEPGSVNYGETAALGSTASDNRGGATTDDTHYVVITGLKANTKYYYEIVSGGETYNNGGVPYEITTGPGLTFVMPDMISGKVYKTGGVTAAEGAIVYAQIGTSQVLSALVNSAGSWAIDIAPIRAANYQSYYAHSETDDVSLSAQGAGDGTASQTVQIAQAKAAAGGAPDMILAIVDTTPPTVVSTGPPDGATNVPVDTVIRAIFSESMNATSVQSAFSILPSVSGAFSWAGGANMTFTPSANLAYHTTYTVTIGTGAQDLAGNPLAQAKVWSFTTGLKPLVAINITPEDPVIKPGQNRQFTATGNYSDNTSGDVTTSVSWGSSNTTVATIVPNTGLAQGLVEGITLITATAGDNVTDNTTLTVDGTNPVVAVYWPYSGYRYAGGSNITISWSVEDANPAANATTIEFYNGASWQTVATNVTEQTPYPPYYYGEYNWAFPSNLNISNARVRITALDKAGNTTTNESGDFTIDSTPPTVTSVYPTNGATNVAVNTTIRFTFSEAMKWESVQGAFSISPPVSGILSYNGTTKTFTPSADLAYNIPYTVTVNTTAEDLAGNPMAAAKVWSFTTVKQPPAVTTGNATGITTSSAILNGILTSMGSYTPVIVSFFWGTSSGSLDRETASQEMTTPGPFSANITGLQLATTYYFKAKATANGVTVYGDILSFTTVRLVRIDISPDNPTVPLGRSQQFTANGTYEDNSWGDVTNIVTWVSSDSTVAEIGEHTGLATTMGKVPGITLITASFEDATPDSTNLTVGPKELETITIKPISASVPVGKTVDFTATGFYSDSSNATITGSVTWVSTNPSVVEIDSFGGANPGQATGKKLGETTIVATKDVETIGGIKTIKSNTANLTVTSAVLASIQITPAYKSIPKGKTWQFTAIGIYSDGSNVTMTRSVIWSSSDNTVATISPTGLAKSLTQGTTNITAYLGQVPSNIAILTVVDPVIEAINIKPQNPVIALGTITTLPFTAWAIYSDGGMTDNTGNAIWSSSDNTVATISPAGVATIIGEGTTNITASLTAPNGVFTGLSVLIVTKPVLQSVQIDDVFPATDNVVPPIAIGDSIPLYLTGRYSAGPDRDLTIPAVWSSSNTAVAKVSSGGVVEGKKFGTANITATHSGLRSTVKVTVTQSPAVATRAADPVVDTTATLNGLLVSLGSASNVSVSFEWGLTTAYGNQTASQTKTATGAFSADLSGLFENTTYHFRAKAVGDGTSYSSDLTFRTSAFPPTVTTGAAANITSSSAIINGTLVDLKGISSANVSFEWGLTTAYSNTIAGTPAAMDTPGSFSANLTGLAPSTTYHFRAKAVGFGASYGADNTFKTEKALVSIEIAPAKPSVAKGKTVQFSASGIYSEGSPVPMTAVNWTSSDNAVATMDATGVATGEGVGTANITATDPATGKFGITTIRVLSPVLESLTVTGPAQFAAGVTGQFSAMGKYSDNSSANITTSVIWTTDNTSIVSVDSTTGRATGRNAGPASINATQGKVSGKATLVVTQATLTRIDVTPSAPVIALGNPQQFRAVGVYSDGRMTDITTSATWTSSNASVAANPVNGLVATLGKVAGTTNITATVTFDSVTINGSAILTVKEAQLTAITISANVTAIPSGRAEKFTAIGTYTSGPPADITKQVNWVSSNVTTARINAAGVANSFAPGTTEITASLGVITSNAIPLTVVDPVLDALRVRPVNPRVTLVSGSNQTLQFAATGIYSGGATADNTTDAAWSSSDNSVATVSSTGLATIVGEGKATIMAVLLTASRSTELTVLPDKLSPVVTLTTPAEGLVLSEKTLTISGKVDDTAANTTVIVNDTPFSVALGETGGFSQDVPLKIGSNAIRVRAIDGVGNTGASGTVTVVVDVDKVKPGITVTKPLPSERLTDDDSLTVEGSITGNFTSATLIFNGVSVTPFTVTGGNFSANVTLLGGVNIIVVNAYTTNHSGDADYLGTSGVVEVILDTDAPVLLIDSPVSGSVTSIRLGEVSGTVGDPWVTSVALTVNDIPQSVTVVEGTFSQDVTLQPGLNTIIVEATDEAGNESSVTLTITLDTSVPGVTITAPANKLLTNTAAQIVTGNITDPSITEAKLYLNDVGHNNPQSIPVAPDGSFSQAIPLASGSNTIEVTASDSADPPNTGTSGVVNLELDKKAPTIIVSLSNPTKSILITVTSNETLLDLPAVRITGRTSLGAEVAESVNMTLAGVNKWTVSYGSEANPIDAGEYRVTVTGTDKAGNAATVTATFAKKTIDVSGVEPTTVTTPTTTLEVETEGAVSDVDISVTQHIDNPSGNVGNPEAAEVEVGVFVEIIAPPELSNNLKQIYIQVDYDPDELPEGTDESTLKLYLWDVTLGTWQEVPDSGANVTGHYVYGTVSHLSKYGTFGSLLKEVAVAEQEEAPGASITFTAGSSGLSAPNSLRVDSNGIVQAAIQLKTLDGKATLSIVKGVKALDSRGNALASISASGVTSPSTPPAESAVISAYDFGPDGARFEPAITLTVIYDPGALPEGVTENELYLAYWDGSQWLALESRVDTEANAVSATISHFTQFAVIGKLPAPVPAAPAAPPTPPVLPVVPPPAAPAAFTTSAMAISPTEVSIGESVAISVLVTNTGDLSGSYEVILKIDNQVIDSKTVTLDGGASQAVTFTTARDTYGIYAVTVNGLSGTFTVKGVEEVTPVQPTPAAWWIWLLIGVAVVVVIGLLLYFFVWRRRAASRPS